MRIISIEVPNKLTKEKREQFIRDMGRVAFGGKEKEVNKTKENPWK